MNESLTESTVDPGRARREFLSQARHELCTPINAILGYSEMLIEDAEDQQSDALTDLRRLHDDGRRLLTLTSVILDTAKVPSEAGSLRDVVLEVQLRMRAPVKAVLGRCALLIEAAEDELGGYACDLRKIHTSGERLLDLIDHLDQVDRPVLENERGDTALAAAADLVAADEIAAVRELGQASLLVVDDNDLNREMLSRRLCRLGFTVTLAEDGYRALELLRTRPFDLVLLDIRMPGLDGIQVLGRIRQSFSVKDLPVIMATADDRSEDIVQTLAAGANDYVTKPFDFPVVVARVHTQLSLKRAVQALEAAHARMKGDLEAAARVQHAMMPAQLPNGAAVRFAWSFQPCDELAGDGLGIQQLDDRHVGLYVLDVSGHGVRSALLAVTVNRLLSHTNEGSIVLKGPAGYDRPGPVSPADVASHLNRRFPVSPADGQYFTLFYGVFNLDTRELVYVSAGHPPPILLRGNESAPLETPNNFPIGWFQATCFEESRVVLEPADRLYVCSDGVLEAGDPEAEPYDKRWMLDPLCRLRSVTLQESVDGLTRQTRERDMGKLTDDVSIIAIEIDGD
jgi:sigma-B regulation protein RsbU (phosphoserine phosphatase)